MKNKYFVHESSFIDEDVKIGENTKIWHFSHIQKGAVIGRNCSIGQNVNIADNVIIGDGVKIQNNVSVYRGVKLEDHVFCGPSCVFTNVLTPRSKFPKGSENFIETLVEEGASIGANATIVCGHKIGRLAMVGAGAVVTRDVKAHSLVVGNPARHIAWVCECGEKLDSELKCHNCQKLYSETEEGLCDESNPSVLSTQSPKQFGKMKIEFRNLKKQYEKLKTEIDKQIAEVLEAADFINGKKVKELEEVLADYVGVKHCITCGSGTDALRLILQAWRIREGDAVFVPSFTFFATTEVVAMCNATPVFVDVEKDTFNICVKSLRAAIEAVIREGKLKPRAVISVDLFGLPANYPEIERLAGEYNLLILSDTAQGFGGNINGKMAGSFGDGAITSFFPSKPFGCYGDGGSIFTNDDDTAALLGSLKAHGKNGDDKHDNIRIGTNSRLDTIQAAVLLPKLKALVDYELRDTDFLAKKYSEKLKDKFHIPYIPQGYCSAWAQYTITLSDCDERDKLQNYLKEKEIPTAIYYRKGAHRQGVFKDIKNYVDLPNTEYLCERVLSLPFSPYLTVEEVDYILDALLNWDNVTAAPR